MSHVIANIIDQGAGVKEFQLRRQDGAPLPAWRPGSHLVLGFASADGGAFEKHYSLIGAPGTTDAYRIAVLREADGAGGSRSLHDDKRIGDALDVSGPFDSFPLHAPAADARAVLIAGGIGITPMISMAHALGAQGKPFELHYLVHDAERLVLLDELLAIPHGSIVPHISAESGRADLAQILGSYTKGDTVYACGPATLLQGLAAAGDALGWPSNAMRFESFGARVQAADMPLTVELSLTQITVEVQPGTSILDALIAADVFVSYDCKRGECGNCYTQVLEGSPLHRDVCLTPAMRSEGMCTCVSWADAPGRLVLEL